MIDGGWFDVGQLRAKHDQMHHARPGSLFMKTWPSMTYGREVLVVGVVARAMTSLGATPSRTLCIIPGPIVSQKPLRLCPKHAGGRAGLAARLRRVS
jgi:hypothetical protein